MPGSQFRHIQRFRTAFPLAILGSALSPGIGGQYDDGTIGQARSFMIARKILGPNRQARSR
jgi:hypothetical protein